MTQPQEVLRKYQQLLTTNNSVSQPSFSSMVLNGVTVQGSNNRTTQEVRYTRSKKKKKKMPSLKPVKILFLKDGKLYIGGDRDEPVEVYEVPSGWILTDRFGQQTGYLNNLGSGEDDWLLNLAIRQIETNNFQLKVINASGVVASRSFTLDNPLTLLSGLGVIGQNSVFSGTDINFKLVTNPVYPFNIISAQIRFITLFWDSVNNIFNINSLDLEGFGNDFFVSGNLPVNALNDKFLDNPCFLGAANGVITFASYSSQIVVIGRDLTGVIGIRSISDIVYIDYIKNSGTTTYLDSEFSTEGVLSGDFYSNNLVDDEIYSAKIDTLTEKSIAVTTTTLGTVTEDVSQDVDHLGFGSLSSAYVVDVSFDPLL